MVTWFEKPAKVWIITSGSHVCLTMAIQLGACGFALKSRLHKKYFFEIKIYQLKFLSEV